jgi:hypothetical protein
MSVGGKRLLSLRDRGTPNAGDTCQMHSFSVVVLGKTAWRSGLLILSLNARQHGMVKETHSEKGWGAHCWPLSLSA